MIFVCVFLGFLLLRIGVSFWNIWADTRISGELETNEEELISILIPAKNEEKNILHLLQSILDQDYKNIEVLILDDSSNDGTYALVAQFIEKDPRFHIHRGLDLPKNWMGKNFACHQLASFAKGDFFLFLDADVSVKSGLLKKSLSRMKRNKLSLLSLFADQRMESLGEWLTVPLMNYFLLSFLPLPLIQKSKHPSLAAANGQFMLFPGKSYKQFQWHSQVKNKVAEDYEICKKVKEHQLLAETLLSDGYLNCRMYTGFGQGIDGFTKNTYALFNYNLTGIFLFILMIFGMDIAIFILGNGYLLFLILFLILILKSSTTLLSRQNLLLNLILHPFQIGVMVYISLLSAYKNIKGTLVWKGRIIPPFSTTKLSTLSE